MSVDAEGLVLQPFQELAETARLAVANAEAALAEDAASAPAERMLKAARGLVKEGDRALQRIQPLWTAQADKYGDAFRDAIRDHEGISESRRVLDDLLYDLDDYIELDTFDPERYGEIQAASKTFALNAIEAIKRLKLETPAPAPPAHGPLPPPGSPLVAGFVFPPLPPLPPGKSLGAQRPSTSGGRHPDDVRQPKLKPRPVSHLESMRNGSNLSNESNNQLHRTETRRSQASSIQSSESHGSSTVSHRLSGQWPLKPSPLQLGQTNSADDRGMLSPLSPVSPETEDRQTSAQFAAESPSSPSPIDIPSMATQINTSIPRTSEWVTDQVSSRSHHRSSRTDTIPEDDVIDHTATHDGDAQDGGERSNRNTMASAYRNSYVFEAPASPTSTSYRTSVLSDTSENNHRVSGIKLVGRASEEAAPGVPPLPGHHVTGPPVSPNIDIPPRNPSRLTHRRGDSLLANVVMDARAQSAAVLREEEKEPAPEPWYSLRPACSIGDDSSVRRLGPLCNGALRFRQGGGQTATIAGLVQGVGVTVAQCINCKYRHTLSEIECDSNADARANFCKAGINFRLRFLYKSHLPTDSGRSSYYACVFCELSGRTASADDATVFTSQEQLFNHLARHPRPLPEVPDFKVVYGPLDKEDVAFETFDLHFPHAPAANPLADIDPETPKRFPSAMAVTDHVNRPGKRDLADPDGGKDDVLEFLGGARIVGVEFPERWGGKWCTGWHNGFHGSFPLKAVTLNPPPTSDVRLPGTNNDGVTVTSRWKWQPKDADAGWLTFDKNAVISNVSWLDQDQWCWSGMTKDGKVGFFPSSHTKPESVQEAGESPDSGGGGHRKYISSKFFSIRRSGGV